MYDLQLAIYCCRCTCGTYKSVKVLSKASDLSCPRCGHSLADAATEALSYLPKAKAASSRANQRPGMTVRL